MAQNTTHIKVALVIGVGPGIGGSVAKKFASEGFSVGLIGRNLPKLEGFQSELLKLHPTVKVACAAADASKEEELKSAISSIKEKIGNASVLVYNTGGVFKRGSVLDLTTSDFTASFNAQVVGAFVASKEVLPHMIANNHGTIILTGATAQTRGGALLSAFASSKFALKAFAQSMAREFQPKGIHVAIVNIDGIVKDTQASQNVPTAPEEKFINPNHVAETYYQLHLQNKSAWTHELDLRPFTETW